MKNPFVDEYGINGWGIAAAIALTVAALVGITWGIWVLWLRGPSCDPPNHLVFSGTSVEYVLVGKILVPMTVNDYECVGP